MQTAMKLLWRTAVLLLLVVLIFLIWLLLTSSKDRRWYEEVRLPDGDAYTVDRRTYGIRVLGGIGDAGGANYGANQLNILERGWTGESLSRKEKGTPGRWLSKYWPLLLARDNNKEWIIIAVTTMCEDWEELGYPRSPYVQYRWANFQWRQEPLDPLWHGQAANLLIGTVARDAPGALNLKEKATESSKRIPPKRMMTIDYEARSTCERIPGF